MPIYLDDQAVQLPGNDLQVVIEAAMTQLAAQNRVVVEVRLNGQTLLGDELNQSHEQALRDGCEIRLYSADPRELASITLDQLGAQLEQVRQMHSDIATLLQQSKNGEALQKLGQTLDLWQQTQQGVLFSVMLLDQDIDSVTVDDEPVGQIVESLIEQLKSLRDVIASGDSVGLSDAMEYEWPQTTERWIQVVQTLATRLRS